MVGCTPWQKEVLLAELARHDAGVPAPTDMTAEVRWGTLCGHIMGAWVCS